LKTLQGLCERFNNHPVIRQMEEDEKNELLEKRIRSSQAIEKLEKEQKEVVGKLRVIMGEEEAKCKQAKTNYDAAILGMRKAKCDLSSGSSRAKISLTTYISISYVSFPQNSVVTKIWNKM